MYQAANCIMILEETMRNPTNLVAILKTQQINDKENSIKYNLNLFLSQFYPLFGYWENWKLETPNLQTLTASCQQGSRHLLDLQTHLNFSFTVSSSSSVSRNDAVRSFFFDHSRFLLLFQKLTPLGNKTGIEAQRCIETVISSLFWAHFLSADLALEIRRRHFVWVSSFRYLCYRNDGVPVFPFTHLPSLNDVVWSYFPQLVVHRFRMQD